jgi:hypothetical protein
LSTGHKIQGPCPDPHEATIKSRKAPAHTTAKRETFQVTRTELQSAKFVHDPLSYRAYSTPNNPWLFWWKSKEGKVGELNWATFKITFRIEGS